MVVGTIVTLMIVILYFTFLSKWRTTNKAAQDSLTGLCSPARQQTAKHLNFIALNAYATLVLTNITSHLQHINNA